MQKGTLIAIVAIVAIAACAAGAYVALGGGGSDDEKVVTEIVTDDPERETAEAEGRLWIVGNANLDDVLDEKDVEWIEKILNGEANEVVFNAGLSDTWSVDVRMADANQDGKISQEDIDMVESLIAMTADSPKQLVYYVDVDGAVSSAHVPIKTVISTYEQNSKQLQTIHALDAVVACDKDSVTGHIYAQGTLTEDMIIFNSYNERADPDAQLIMSYNPDAVLTGTRLWYCNTLEESLPSERTSMDIVRISSWEDNKVLEGTLTLGFLMCKNEEAQEYVEWADGWLNLIQEKVSTLSEDEIVKVLCPRGEYDDWNVTMNGPRSGKYETSLEAGAYNVIIDNLTSNSTNVVVDDEWVKAQTDLDYIVCIVYGDLNNGEKYGYTNKSFYDEAVEYWSGMTELYGTQVHVLDNLVGQGTTFVIGAVYMAKWFYPDLFADMDPDAIFQEFMDEFLQYDFDVAAYQAGGGIAIRGGTPAPDRGPGPQTRSDTMGGLKEWLSEDVGSRRTGGRPTFDAIEQSGSLYEEYDRGGTEPARAAKSEYRAKTVRKILFAAFCAAAVLAVSGVVITYGNYPLSFAQVYGILWSHVLNGAPDPSDALAYMNDHVVWNLRLPRVVVAVVAGFGLAVAGAVMQSTLKNPMADSYTTGVSAGAAFGATVSIVCGFTFVSYDFSLLANAFVFSLAPTALIVILSARARVVSSTSMILAGLAVMYIFNACTTALKLMADPDALSAIYRWQVGSLNNMGWNDVPAMLTVTAAGSVAVMALSSRINILASGDESAKALGIDASKLRIVCLAVTSLIAASIVSYTGTIGFVGLVSPHIARIFVGSDNRYLIPASAAFGALLMLVSDFIGRTILAPSVLEVGIVTAFIGGPMFLWLIVRQKKEVWT